MDFRVPVDLQVVLGIEAKKRGVSLKGEMLRRLKLSLSADGLLVIENEAAPREKRKGLRHQGG